MFDLYVITKKKFRPLVKLLKTYHKLLFSDVISMAGIRGGLNAVSCVKSTKVGVKNRCPQKPAKLHG